MKVIILLGAPGSGKGTQAARIRDFLAVPHISTGDMLRQQIKEGTSLGKKAKEYMDAGQYVPDSLVFDMLFSRLSQPDAKKGYLLDGFPRTQAQAEELMRRLSRDAEIVAINLRVADAAVVKRLSNRFTCSQCGRIYNNKLAKCETCDGSLTQRSDDKPEVVAERLKVYHNQTDPVIAYYRDKKLLKEVDGERSPDAVFASLQELLR